MTSREGEASAAIDWLATLRAKRTLPFDASHLRYRRKRGDAALLHCFVLDCSGSMLEGERLARAKGMLIALFDRAYRERAEVALVCFGGGRAEVRRQPGAAHWWNERWIAPIGGGGGTPLALGLADASTVLERAARRKPAQRRWLWLLTDGRTNESPAAPHGAHRTIVVDFDEGHARVGRCEALASAWRAEHVHAASLLLVPARGVDPIPDATRSR
ncbi:ChlD component of cobalt chelatase involved in B12 biosynthesis [Candidatus Burkholderia verschuerenii]|uniref:ChlD component of cobalt chelatase involved in B12 biosynthesis n=1 Tax=Candidatus Burkholderia verschuerenii TaxID=242163 RepID=A0A0L0MAB0_9BURK|nr:VWA domain-containing protein [Candidatus Burkholderia verschuerenii]KND59617.1 ChlD component of cobalt chelatase involved in B12 biosynthesis [Candidatus Burkholderia verschuerenii]